MIPADINYQTAGLYNPLIEDYFSGELKKKGIIDWEYSLDEILRKSEVRKFKHRHILHQVLSDQYNELNLLDDEAEPVKRNLDALLNSNTQTICTGHQLCIYGGPAYFYSKMIDAIQLAKKLNTKSTNKHFVPVFWMASEDHDFEEIQSVNIFHKKITWENKATGAVGAFDTASFSSVHEEWSTILGSHPKAIALNETFNKAYLSGHDLATATRIFVHELFKNEGLLILDGNDKNLKQLFLPLATKELTDSIAEQNVTKQIKQLEGYKIQAVPRPTNLFFLAENYRSRIIVKENTVTTADGQRTWEFNEFIELINKEPERISPNVFLRPLYQEICLPNIAYVGGAGEISYWLELPLLFKASSIDFPVPVVRNSYIYLTKKQLTQIEQLKLQTVDFFQDDNQILNQFIKNNQEKTISLEQEKQELAAFFAKLEEIGVKIDPNLSKTIQGELKRSTSNLENIEKRFNNALKNQKEQEKQQISSLKTKLFPNGTFQERIQSIFEFVLKTDENIFDLIQKANTPLNNNIKVIVY